MAPRKRVTSVAWTKKDIKSRLLFKNDEKWLYTIIKSFLHIYNLTRVKLTAVWLTQLWQAVVYTTQPPKPRVESGQKDADGITRAEEFLFLFYFYQPE